MHKPDLALVLQRDHLGKTSFQNIYEIESSTGWEVGSKTIWQMWGSHVANIVSEKTKHGKTVEGLTPPWGRAWEELEAEKTEGWRSQTSAGKQDEGRKRLAGGLEVPLEVLDQSSVASWRQERQRLEMSEWGPVWKMWLPK